MHDHNPSTSRQKRQNGISEYTKGLNLDTDINDPAARAKARRAEFAADRANAQQRFESDKESARTADWLRHGGGEVDQANAEVAEAEKTLDDAEAALIDTYMKDRKNLDPTLSEYDAEDITAEDIVLAYQLKYNELDTILDDLLEKSKSSRTPLDRNRADDKVKEIRQEITELEARWVEVGGDAVVTAKAELDRARQTLESKEAAVYASMENDGDDDVDDDDATHPTPIPAPTPTGPTPTDENDPTPTGTPNPVNTDPTPGIVVIEQPQAPAPKVEIADARSEFDQMVANHFGEITKNKKTQTLIKWLKQVVLDIQGAKLIDAYDHRQDQAKGKEGLLNKAHYDIQSDRGLSSELKKAAHEFLEAVGKRLISMSASPELLIPSDDEAKPQSQTPRSAVGTAPSPTNPWERGVEPEEQDAPQDDDQTPSGPEPTPAPTTPQQAKSTRVPTPDTVFRTTEVRRKLPEKYASKLNEASIPEDGRASFAKFYFVELRNAKTPEERQEKLKDFTKLVSDKVTQGAKGWTYDMIDQLNDLAEEAMNEKGTSSANEVPFIADLTSTRSPELQRSINTVAKIGQKVLSWAQNYKDRYIVTSNRNNSNET